MNTIPETWYKVKTERDDEYVKAYLELGTLKKAGDKCGVCPETIRRAIGRAGVKTTGWQNSARNQAEKKVSDKVLAEAAKTMTRGELSKAFNTNIVNIDRRLKRLGTKAKPAPARSFSDEEWGSRVQKWTNGKFEFVEKVSERQVKIRCTTCGFNFTRGFKSLRHGAIECSWCKECGSSEYEQKNFSIKACKECGKLFISLYETATYCSKNCKRKNKRARSGQDYRERARKHGAIFDGSITLRKVIKRDNNICQICGKPCDSDDLTWGTNGPLYPSIDHILAFANGGNHTWDNVQLAHCICNSIKRDLLYDKEAL